MKPQTFFISRITYIYTKLSRFSISSVKIKARSRRTFLMILLTSAVICKQRPWYENKVVQYFQNYKCYGIDRDHFKKYLQLYKVHQKEQL